MHINLLILSEHVCKVVPVIYAVEVGCNILHLVDHRSQFIFFKQVVELVTVLDLQRGSDHFVFKYMLRILVWLFCNEKPRVQYHVDIMI